MWKKEPPIPTLTTEEDFKKIASYDERKAFVRSHFDKNYTGTTKENAALLKNEKFKKVYLEMFSGIKKDSQKARMDLIAHRPDQNPQVLKVRESLLGKNG